MAEIRKGIGKLAGSGLGKAGAELAGKEVGKEVEGEVTKVTSKVAGKKAGRAVGKAVGEATGEIVGDLAKDVLSTEVGQTAVGEIVGPHPGRAICSFWQGTTETVLRVLTLLGSFAALVTAAVAIGVAHHDKSIDKKLNLSNTTQQELSTAQRVVYGCSGYVIIIALLAIVMELLLVGVRWCNIGAVNLAIKVFLMLDIFISSLFTFLYAIGMGAILYWLITYWDFSSTLQTLRYSLVVCGAVCGLSGIFCTILAVWSSLFRAREWNKKVVKYTLKQVEHELAEKAKHAIEEKIKPIKSAL